MNYFRQAASENRCLCSDCAKRPLRKHTGEWTGPKSTRSKFNHSGFPWDAMVPLPDHSDAHARGLASAQPLVVSHLRKLADTASEVDLAMRSECFSKFAAPISRRKEDHHETPASQQLLKHSTFQHGSLEPTNEIEVLNVRTCSSLVISVRRCCHYYRGLPEMVPSHVSQHVKHKTRWDYFQCSAMIGVPTRHL